MNMQKVRFYLADRSEPGQEVEVSINSVTMKPETYKSGDCFAYRVYNGVVMHRSCQVKAGILCKTRSDALGRLINQASIDRDKAQAILDELNAELNHLQAQEG